LSTEWLRQEFPGIQDDQLLGGAEYYDAQMDDARLCLSVVARPAPRPARVANYVQAVAFENAKEDRLGPRPCQVTGRSSTRARQVLNATGPWIDEVVRLPAMPPSRSCSPPKA